jgi:hypothetical protein
MFLNRLNNVKALRAMCAGCNIFSIDINALQAKIMMHIQINFLKYIGKIIQKAQIYNAKY